MRDVGNNIGGNFSQSKKELTWHRTNQSYVNMQDSYKAADGPKKDESCLFLENKGGKGGKEVKRTMD
jgi:hypothetical protein